MKRKWEFKYIGPGGILIFFSCPHSKKRSKVSRRELNTLNDNNSKRGIVFVLRKNPKKNKNLVYFFFFFFFFFLARRDLPKCPICEYRIEPQYWAEHYQYELSRLSEPTSEAYSDPLNKK
jgi:hypothetical protein